MDKKVISKDLFAAIKVACRLFGESEIYLDYSGRWMYGDTCFGFSGRNLFAIIAKILEIIAGNEELVMEFSELLSNPAQDDLGLGRIIYFPGRIAPSDPSGQSGE